MKKVLATVGIAGIVLYLLSKNKKNQPQGGLPPTNGLEPLPPTGGLPPRPLDTNPEYFPVKDGIVKYDTLIDPVQTFYPTPTVVLNPSNVGTVLTNTFNENMNFDQLGTLDSNFYNPNTHIPFFNDGNNVLNPDYSNLNFQLF